MKKNKKKLILFCTIIVMLLIPSLILTKVLFTKEKEQEVFKIEILKPLSTANVEKASNNVMNNIVKIINTIDKENVIYGTGFFDKSGYLITNSHVIDIKGDIKIVYSDGETSNAKLISNDIVSDIAILHVDNPKVKALPLKSTMDLKVTNEVYAIGYQFNLKGDPSVTKGIVSAKRSSTGVEFIQTDTAVNQGSSGGPLINEYGEVVGMISLATTSGNLAFSISSDTLELYIQKLISNLNITYVKDSRPKNALNNVLIEVGYKETDIYNEHHLYNKKEEIKNNDDEKGKEENKNDDKHENVIVKSSNANIRYLNIQGYNINFSPTNYNYNITTSQTTPLNISITMDHNKASYNIIGNTSFHEGENVISINTKAENGSTKQYNIRIIVPYTKLDRTSDIIGGLNTVYSQALGENAFDLFWDYCDSDRIRLYPRGTSDLFNTVIVNVYAGWGYTKNRLLKSYTFTRTSYNQTHVYIKISDIRSLLTDQDYVGGVYSGADLTFELTVNTKHHGSFTQNLPWGLNK